MREDRVQALVQQMSQQRQAPAVREDRVQSLVKQMQQTHRREETDNRDIERVKSLGRGVVQTGDFLQDWIAKPAQKLIGKVTGLPQPDINGPISEDIYNLAQSAGVNLRAAPAKNKREAIENSAFEAAGSAITPTGLGGLIGKGVNLAGKALPQVVKNIPYISKPVGKAAQLVPELFKGPGSKTEALKQAALAGGVGATSQYLTEEGVDPTTARISAIAAPVVGSAIGKNIGKLNPISSIRRDAEKDYNKFSQSLENRQGIVRESTPILPNQVDYEKVGQELIRPIQEKGRMLHSERESITGPQWNQLQNIQEQITPNQTFSLLSDKEKKLAKENPLRKQSIPFVKKNIFDFETNVPLSVAQLENAMQTFTSLKSQAAKKGNGAKAKFYEDILSTLEQDVRTVPQVMDVRKQYALNSAELNKIRNDPQFKQILRGKDFNQLPTVFDSTIPEKLVNLSDKGKSSQKRLKSILGNDQYSVDQIKAYNFKNLYNSITDSAGNVDKEKLFRYQRDNPGLFIWDSSLRKNLSSLERAQDLVSEMDNIIKSKSGQSVSLKDVLNNKSIGKESIYYLVNGLKKLGVGIGTFGYKPLKEKVYSKHIEKLKSLENKES